MVTIRQELGTGTRRWKILVDGVLLKKGLTKGEAKKLHRLLAPLDGIVRQIVERERDLDIGEMQNCLDRLARRTSEDGKAA